MKLVKILLCLAVASIVLDVQGQTDSPFEKIPNADSLSFLVLQKRNHLGKINTISPVEAEVAYDFQNQYPFFRASRLLELGDSLVFVPITLPEHGFVYVYSLDPDNQPVLHASLVLDDLASNDEVPQFLFEVKTQGSYGLCFLFLKERLKNPEEVIASMEMTHGSFLFRQNGLFGDLLLLPNKKWRLLESEIGFEMDRNFISAQKGTAGVLLYLQMDVATK